MIAVTGSTGEVGGRVARWLASRGAELILPVRDPARAPVIPGARIVTADYAEPESMERAFQGAKTALIVSGMGEPMKRALLHRNAFEAAAAAGVKHIVYTSFQSASPNSAFPYGRDHYLSEQYLKECGVNYSALRDSLYMEMIPHLADEEGVIRGPAGDGRVAFVSREDVARCAVELLLNPPDFSDYHILTGAESLSLSETAQRMTEIKGRKYRFENETEEEAFAWRSKYDVPHWELDVWIGSYLSIAAGEMQGIGSGVKDITGREPQSLEETFSEVIDRQ